MRKEFPGLTYVTTYVRIPGQPTVELKGRGQNFWIRNEHGFPESIDVKDAISLRDRDKPVGSRHSIGTNILRPSGQDAVIYGNGFIQVGNAHISHEDDLV